VIIKIKKAQSTLEYAILIGVVVGALLSMQNFLKRGFQGKLHNIVENLGDPYSPGHTSKLEIFNSNIDTTTETTTPGVAGSTTTQVNGATQYTESSINLDSLDNETWPGNR